MQYAEALARTVTRHSRVYLMKHRALTLSYLLFASVHAAGQGSVLCIVADDVGIDRIAAYGGTALGLHPDPGKTPQIDRLASRGVMFRNAWSSPVCSVARAAMLTGRFGFRTGVGDNIDVGHLGTAIQASEVCLPEILKLGTGGAYTSVGIGKWHLGTSLDGNAHPLSVGFDAHFGLKRGFGQGNYYRWRKLVNGTSYPTFRYATTDSVDDALRAFEASTGPAFVWLSFNAPHRPFHRPPSRLHSFALSGPPDDTPVDHMKAMVEAMDTEIGRLLSSLPAGHADELTVIFIGDNGTSPYATDAPFSPDHAKGTLFEGGIRVPLIIAGPTVVDPGRECHALVQALDLYSTIAELTGVDPRQHLPAGHKLDSKSLCLLLSDPDLSSHKDYLYAEHFSPYGSGITDSERFGVAIRNDRYKLIRRRVSPVHPPTQEMFDLVLDPFEQIDLLLGPLTPDIDQVYLDLGAAFQRLIESE